MQINLTINIDDRIIAGVKRLFTRRFLAIVVVALASGSALVAYAVTVPNPFAPNTPISSSQVNANFSALATATTALESSAWSGTGGIRYFSGNVSIGTTTPGAPLHIRGDGGSNAGLLTLDGIAPPTGSTAFGPHIFFRSAGANRGWLGLFDNPGEGSGTLMNLRGYAGLNLAGASSGQHLYITTGGNVGIGT